MQKHLYEFQFGFGNNCSTTHVLMDITDKVRNAHDKRLYIYGVRGVANDQIKFFIYNRTQYSNVNSTDQDLYPITHGVPQCQCSVFGPLLFLIFINDLQNSVKNSIVYHFVDDTNLLFTNKPFKKINKLVNQDLALIVKWLRATKTTTTSLLMPFILTRVVILLFNLGSPAVPI